MRKQLAVLVGILSLAVNARAITYLDMIDYHNSVILSGAGASRSGTLNILNGATPPHSTTVTGGYADDGTTYTDVDGFVPGTATAASLFFYFRDDTDAPPAVEQVRVRLEANSFNSGVITIGSGANTIFPVVGTVAILAQINDNGLLDFKVSVVSGDFFFDYARLVVPGPDAVPDGGTTILLLGLALVGVEALRRTLAARRTLTA